MIFVLEKVMHAQPKIFQAEFAKVFASYRERIEIVLFEILPKLAAAFLVFSPEKPRRQKEQRHNDRSDDVNAELALQRFYHGTNISFATVATGQLPVPPGNVTLVRKRLTEPWLQLSNVASAITDFQLD